MSLITLLKLQVDTAPRVVALVKANATKYSKYTIIGHDKIVSDIRKTMMYSSNRLNKKMWKTIR